jgi:mRNA interferase MazF
MYRGEVWLYSADPSVGDEIGKTRPAVIVSSDEMGVLRLKIVVPITGWQDVSAPLEGTSTTMIVSGSGIGWMQVTNQGL